MMSATVAISGFYAGIIPFWMALSLWSAQRARAWSFTPRWHRRAVPLLRALFLVTLPLEMWLAERAIIVPVAVLGGIATVGWLGWRAAYLARAPHALPAADSVRYNLAYFVHLAVFALACHSFICLAVLLNVGAAMLMLREHRARLPGLTPSDQKAPDSVP